MENKLDGQKDNAIILTNLEKANDTIPRDGITKVDVGPRGGGRQVGAGGTYEDRRARCYVERVCWES